MKKNLLFAAMAAFVMNVALSGQTITVTSPAAGDEWCLDSTHNITWTSSGVTGAVDVILRLAENPTAPPVQGIAAATANDGTAGWTIPASIAPGMYLVRVRSIDDPAVYDDSSAFEIRNCAAAAITVTNPPASGWCIGSSHTITWTSSGITGNMDIILRPLDPSAPPTLGIAANTNNDGTEGWTITASVAPGMYLIRVRSINDPAVYDDSTAFEIRNCAAGSSITVTAPDAASSWRPGSRQTISWTKTGALNPMANITLRREGAPESEAAAARIADGCANNGSRVWFISDSLAEGRYFVRVKSGGVQGDSAVFALSAGGRGSDLPGPDTPIRADLEIPGVGIEHFNSQVVVWVKNNGPESLRNRDVKFRLNFPEGGRGEQIITRRITVPVGAEERVELQAMEASAIPDAGLRTIVRIDTSSSNIQDANRLNQHRDVRIGILDIRCEIPRDNVTRSKLIMQGGWDYKIVFWIHVRHNLDREVRNIRIKWEMLDSGGIIRGANGSFTIPSLGAGHLRTERIEQKFGKRGRGNAHEPMVSPGTRYRIVASISDPENALYDIQPGNDSSSISFSFPD